MQNDTIFVLLDLSRHLEQLENNADGLGRFEFSVLKRLSAQLLVQHIGSTVQQKPHAVGGEGGVRSPVGGQITF
jgi:hypothetical protein